MGGFWRSLRRVSEFLRFGARLSSFPRSGVGMPFQTLCVILQNKVSLARRLIESGSRPRRRDTFLCSAKEKYPKERRPGCRLGPAFLAFAGGCQKGLPWPSGNALHPCSAPVGLFPAKAPVLGAAYGMKLVVPTSLLRFRTAFIVMQKRFCLVPTRCAASRG
jgi:hypothetical protein